jgi:hypothetical protein
MSVICRDEQDGDGNLGFIAYATTDAPPLLPMSPRGIRWRPGHALNCATLPLEHV